MKKELKRDECLGAVNFNGNWHFLALYVGEWILDYPSYEPYSDKSKKNYRNGLWIVNEKTAAEFLEAMKNEEMSQDDVRQLIKEKSEDEIPLLFVINFDERLFVDGHPDRDIAEFVPEGWKGVEDSPLKYVPASIKSIWSPIPA